MEHDRVLKAVRVERPVPAYGGFVHGLGCSESNGHGRKVQVDVTFAVACLSFAESGSGGNAAIDFFADTDCVWVLMEFGHGDEATGSVLVVSIIAVVFDPDGVSVSISLTALDFKFVTHHHGAELIFGRITSHMDL